MTFKITKTITVLHLQRCSKTLLVYGSGVSSAETSALQTHQPGGAAQKWGPANSQYVVLFTQRMIKVP